jgi:hypothetical protein
VRASVKAGGQRHPFSGRLGGKALASGSYRAKLTAINGADKRSTPKTVSFRVLLG